SGTRSNRRSSPTRRSSELGGGLEVGETLLIPSGGLGQHQGQLRDPLAVPAGVGALGIDRAGDQLDHGIQQLLLVEQQALAVDAQDRKSTRLNSSHVKISYA